MSPGFQFGGPSRMSLSQVPSSASSTNAVACYTEQYFGKKSRFTGVRDDVENACCMTETPTAWYCVLRTHWTGIHATWGTMTTYYNVRFDPAADVLHWQQQGKNIFS
jgi:hypothetical protein